MPRGHEHISFVFSSAFRGTFFLNVFLECNCNGKKDPCAVFGCNNGRLFPEKYTVKDRISNTKPEKGNHYHIQMITSCVYTKTIFFFCNLGE